MSETNDDRDTKSGNGKETSKRPRNSIRFDSLRFYDLICFIAFDRQPAWCSFGCSYGRTQPPPNNLNRRCAISRSTGFDTPVSMDTSAPCSQMLEMLMLNHPISPQTHVHSAIDCPDGAAGGRGGTAASAAPAAAPAVALAARPVPGLGAVDDAWAGKFHSALGIDDAIPIDRPANRSNKTSRL